MQPDRWAEAIERELTRTRRTRGMLTDLLSEIGPARPSPHSVTATSTYLANLYGGLERVLTGLCKRHGTSVPEGSTWHSELLECFSEEGGTADMRLLPRDLVAELRQFLAFRHVATHGYAPELEWERLLPATARVEAVFGEFERLVRQHLGGEGSAASPTDQGS